MISETEAHSVLLGLQRATHHTLQAITARLADLELTPSEINTLANLSDGRSRNMRELSADTGTRSTTLTGVLDRLERRGHVSRDLDPGDRRSFRLTLTAQGRGVAATVRASMDDLEREVLKGLSDRQLAGFHAVIAALQEVGT